MSASKISIDSSVLSEPMKIAELANRAGVPIEKLVALAKKKRNAKEREAASSKLARKILSHAFASREFLQKNTRILASQLLTFPNNDEVQLFVGQQQDSILDASMRSETSLEESMGEDHGYDTTVNSLDVSHAMSCDDSELVEEDIISSGIKDDAIEEEQTATDSSSVLKDQVIQAIINFPRFRAHHMEKILEILNVDVVNPDVPSDTESTTDAESVASNFSDSLEDEKLPTLDNNREKFSLLKLMSESNLSSYQAQNVAEELIQPEKARGLSSRNLRRLTNCSEELSTEQLIRVIENSDEFVLGTDGSKIASKNSKCIALSSDSAPSALKACRLIMSALDKIHPRERLQLKCSMHRVVHCEKGIRSCIKGVFDSILEFCEAYLTCSRNHGLHSSKGQQLEVYLQALRLRDGLERVTKPLEMQSHVRFGNLTHNTQRLVVNYTDITSFVRYELELEDDAKVMEENKSKAVCEFASSALVYSVIVAPYWSRVSGLLSSENYLGLEEYFIKILRDVAECASPALFLLEEAKKTEVEWECGFEMAVLQLTADQNTSKYLDDCIKLRLKAVNERFSKFAIDCSFPFTKEITFTNQDCERSFSNAKDLFSRKFNMDTKKFETNVMTRFNMTYSFWQRQPDFEEKLSKILAKASSKEAKNTERRKSLRIESAARKLEEIQEGEARRTRLAVFHAVIGENKLWPSDDNENDENECFEKFLQLIKPSFTGKVSLREFRGHVLDFLNSQLSEEDRNVINSTLKKKRSKKELFTQTVEFYNKNQ
ncbi:Oidioi.mRNA.OKI2018_I69.XSR.g14271.t1.cds [Oikopleura dioica]|uniref:Oidioi.mRNA.OKI2018_I69.XSR.g14271.t1.cds n=1 Tax=Oikopleura dioica TaxID=34765 RepID=A0ABN7SFK6_OIKDI|nr:Oidioi.mRNA.OKI2018_I69.XSR.g14271.t1.cds [Oikopleura dioica]